MFEKFTNFLDEIQVGAIGLLLIISMVILFLSGILLQTLIYAAITIVIIALWGEYFLPKQLREWIKLGFVALAKRFIAYENKLYDHKETIEIEAEIRHYKWKRMKHFFARILITFIATIFFIIEELFWELTFKKIFAWLEIFPWIQAKKDEIPKMHKYWILTLFLSCFALMEVLGLSAPIIAYYSIFAGLLVYISKFLLLIPVKFIFNVGEEKLMQIDWFSVRYYTTMDSLNWFKTTQSYVKVHNVWNSIRGTFKEWFASDTSFIREVKVLFKSLKTWLESFAEISKKVEEEEMAKHNSEEKTSDKSESSINEDIVDESNVNADIKYHVYANGKKITRKARTKVDADLKAKEYKATNVYKNSDIEVKE